MAPQQLEPVGVLVGRFQTPALHSAHKTLIGRVACHPSGVIFVGTNPIIGLRRHPIPPMFIVGMIQDYLRSINVGNVVVTTLPDTPTDSVWVQQLDSRIAELFPLLPARIYTGPDGIGDTYKGRYAIERLSASDLPTAPHATAMREAVMRQAAINSVDFRKGLIYATLMKPPITRVAVDIAITQSPSGPLQVVLIKKNSEHLWRFPGGMVDPGDANLETTAKREGREETGLEISDPQYVTNGSIRDWRLEHEAEGAVSTLFHAHRLRGVLEAGDDAHQAKWWTVTHQLDIAIMPEHRPFFEAFYNWAQSRGMFKIPPPGPEANYERT